MQRRAGLRTCWCRPASRPTTAKVAGPHAGYFKELRRDQRRRQVLLRHAGAGDAGQAEGSVHADLQQRLPGGQHQRGRAGEADERAHSASSRKDCRVTRQADRQPWGAILAFLLPAFTVYTALTAYPVVRTFWNSFHKVLPQQRGIPGPRELRRAHPGRHLLARGQEHFHLGMLLAAGGDFDRAAARPCAVREDSRHALLPHRVVHAGPHVVRGGRHRLGVDVQLRLGRGQRVAALAGPLRLSCRRGSAIRRSRCPR